MRFALSNTSMNRKETYGLELAQKVSDYLQLNESIGNSHYGYCGVGFVFCDGIIHYTHFDEWLTYTHGKRYKPGGEYEGIIRTFTSSSEFVEWLSKQSDDSLSGKETNDKWYIDNQRITRKRLLSFVEQGHA